VDQFFVRSFFVFFPSLSQIYDRPHRSGIVFFPARCDFGLRGPFFGSLFASQDLLFDRTPDLCLNRPFRDFYLLSVGEILLALDRLFAAIFRDLGEHHPWPLPPISRFRLIIPDTHPPVRPPSDWRDFFSIFLHPPHSTRSIAWRPRVEPTPWPMLIPGVLKVLIVSFSHNDSLPSALCASSQLFLISSSRAVPNRFPPSRA